jgi:YVTN family beta-propeller protein
VDAQKHAVIGKVVIAGDGAKPMGAVAAPDGRHVYVTTGRGQAVVVIDTATNTAVASIPVTGRPWGIAISADGRTLYTANGPANDVAVIDVATRAVTRRVPAGDSPWGLVLLP